MTTGPTLAEGEVLIHDHIPSVAKFKKAALIVLALTLIPTAANAIAFPDTIWVAVPLFVASLILMQERFTMGKHRAWVTDSRIILQSDVQIAGADVSDVSTRFGIVTVTYGGGRLRLYYSDDTDALSAAILLAKKETA